MNEEWNQININIDDPLNQKRVVQSLEELVQMFVAWSVPPSFHIEALKAQSIIMRTKIVRMMNLNGGPRKQAELTLSLEKYPDLMELEEYRLQWGDAFECNKQRLETATQETERQIILYNNRPIDARYHFVCGGATENSENVDGNVVQYLRRVLCKSCGESHYNWQYEDVPLEEIESKLGVEFPKDEIQRSVCIEKIFQDVYRDETGRVKEITIGGKVFRGKELMDLLDLHSTRFTWKPQIIRFFTVGKGDGLGLCQYGAHEMAKSGKRCNEILEYYYTGVTIKKFINPCIKTPLKGKIIMIDPAHGGQEGEGHVGSQGIREEDVNLDIALYLRELLVKLGAEIHMTRRTDEHLPISQRAHLANEKLPHFFISIHQNYFSHPAISGTEIYHYRGDHEGRSLAKEIIQRLTAKTGMVNRGLKLADFFLLRELKVSSIHIEVAYLSNPEEEKKLMDGAFKKKVAEGIAEGIINYYRYHI
ncbi:SpoIID/LytB domain protein [Alkaliphilus metalliredigens QYMF]|uniref:SpoIID/LytB domain protein n=1 Tax=Alkaliphilus metalliredigens (strain QYMF) TaxID=293826 RepID=A6TWW4_ALKMQ|nr:N-acetylmuramoyl-L-alanine amidase [Alkaliphilus metalliredigens]ABR50682.1 SpoIID/LytB domain protein [Alkaliphilus metalliredigens QYMF]